MHMLDRTITLNTQKKIGPEHPSYIIAEVGSNHDGNLERAKKLISLAKETGADAVKFQSFKTHNLINDKTKKHDHWEEHPALKILEPLSMPLEWYRELNGHANAEEIDFLSTPFDLERLDLLVNLNVPAIKIASGDLNYIELLKKVAQSKKPVFLSTGASYLSEVDEAVRILRSSGCEEIVLMQCTSLYPPKFEEVNIRAMKTLESAFQVLVGYSDHAPGWTVVLGAVALGACIIEKHFTDDNSRSGPDHAHSLNPTEFTAMITQVRELETALGNGLKQPCTAEDLERILARRAIYAKIAIAKETKLTRDMLKIVRPALPDGISANLLSSVEGKIVNQNIEASQLIKWDLF
jgi:N,N'-diacetyllegionaminate synthase